MKSEEYQKGWNDAIDKVNMIIYKQLFLYNHGKTKFQEFELEEYIDIPDYKISALTKLQDIINQTCNKYFKE